MLLRKAGISPATKSFPQSNSGKRWFRHKMVYTKASMCDSLMPGLYVDGCYGLFPLLKYHFFRLTCPIHPPSIWVMNNTLAKLIVSPWRTGKWFLIKTNQKLTQKTNHPLTHTHFHIFTQSYPHTRERWDMCQSSLSNQTTQMTVSKWSC